MFFSRFEMSAHIHSYHCMLPFVLQHFVQPCTQLLSPIWKNRRIREDIEIKPKKQKSSTALSVLGDLEFMKVLLCGECEMPGELFCFPRFSHNLSTDNQKISTVDSFSLDLSLSFKTISNVWSV